MYLIGKNLFKRDFIDIIVFQLRLKHDIICFVFIGVKAIIYIIALIL